MLYAIEIVPPLGLVAWSVTATEEMYQPFAPNVPARFNVVYGRHAPPSRRYCTPCTPLPTSVAVRVMFAEPTYDPSGAGVPRTWADVTGFDVSMFALTVRVASLFPAMSVA